jgi:hypothetical protein
MKKLLNTFICILLTSPLAAFDIALEGVEFGKLQMTTTQSTWTGGTEFLSEVLILNEGDVLQVLRFSTTNPYVTYEYRFSNNSGGSSSSTYSGRIYCTSGAVESTVTGDYIVGPASIQLGYKFVEVDNRTETYTYSDGIIYAELDYAILRAGASTQSSYVTIPANPSGNFEVKLQTSTDLETWTPTTPGVFPYGNNAKFFRLVVE